MLDRAKLIGMSLGLWLGFIWVVWGFGEALLVALAGAIGYVVVLAVTGELQAWIKAIAEARE
jgi:hypothetical protein